MMRRLFSKVVSEVNHRMALCFHSNNFSPLQSSESSGKKKKIMKKKMKADSPWLIPSRILKKSRVKGNCFITQLSQFMNNMKDSIWLWNFFLVGFGFLYLRTGPTCQRKLLIGINAFMIGMMIGINAFILKVVSW